MPDRMTASLPRPDPPTLGAFRTTFPELNATADDARVQQLLAVAYQMHSTKAAATLYLAAHLVVLESERGGVDGGSGEVAKETSVGGKAVEYRTMAASGQDVFYTRTSYGRQFLALERRTARHGLPIMVL